MFNWLVFVSLILPVLAISKLPKYALFYGYIISAAGYILGLIFAALLDFPAGAVIVYSLAFTVLFFVAYRKISSGKLSA